MGGEDVNDASMKERLWREGVAVLEVLRCCGWLYEEAVSSESLRFASAFLLFGTSCNLKGSAAEDGAGEAC